ncbi:MAG TPA: tyrosine-type recombinase/integrase [Gemmataceae bacterium]|jgi:integrase|nr:tyrosine-type recombinase/integrase [Gemmataceae bacterium]
MAHFPKPFFRPKKNRWYVQLDGKHVNLGPDETEAIRQYHKVMAERNTPVPVVISALSNPSLSGILDEFLTWCLRHREKRTYETYRERIQSFLDALPDKSLAAKDLRPFHLQEWVDGHEDWNPGMKRGRLQAVQRALNWAVKQGRIDKSPIAFMEKPPPGKRENVIEPETYAAMHERTSGEFQDLITVCWEVGCRPQEIWRVEKRHLDVSGSRWVFPAKEAKGKRKIRVVYLTEAALLVCMRLAKSFPTGPLFRNSDALPWNRHSVSCVFLRMKKRLRKKFALVDFRHTFATRSLQNGVDPVTLSILLGHADGAMLCRTYAHLDQDDGHIRRALAKANASTPVDAVV